MANTLLDFSNALADAVERAGQSVVTIREAGQRGVSGTVWREGVVVTAEHTLRGRQEFTVVLPGGGSTKGTVAGRDPGTDVAVLKLSGTGPAAAPRDAAELRVGHLVLAVGRRESDGLNASYGVIGAVGGAWRTWQGGRIDRYLRLDLLPYPGFSGGPLVDVQGRVLGMNTSGPRRSIVTIPASTLERVVPRLLEKGHVSRGYLGAGLQAVALPAALREAIGQKHETGLLIITLAAGGPAEQAGLLLGDILVSVDGSVLATVADLQVALDPERVGSKVPMQVVRGGKLIETKVTIGERPRE
jgi:S1-C subfamily serine protease